MKKINLIVIVLLLLSSSLYSQPYVQTTPNFVQLPNSSIMPYGRVYFDLSEINTNYLDIATTLTMWDIGYTMSRKGNWNSNIGNGSFGALNNDYINEIVSGHDNIYLNGTIFVKLRDAVQKKDLVVVRTDKLSVFWNDNNSITTSKQDIASGNGNKISKGNFYREHSRNDVAIVNGGIVRIYKNLGNGYLNTSYTQINAGGSNIAKLGQINEALWPYRLYTNPNNTNKTDLVVADGNDLKIYINDNNNNVSHEQTIQVSGNGIKDICISDVNNDFYNDIIVVGKDYNTAEYYLKVYLNYSGEIESTPTTEIITNNFISWDALVTTADFNRDGWNDILTGSNDERIAIWINTQSGSLFEETPDQSMTGAPYNSIYQIKAADTYENKGGLALFVSKTTGGIDGGNYSLKYYNPVTPDANPLPSVIFGSVHTQGGYNRPKITIYNRGDRDYSYYKIYKMRPGNLDYVFLADLSPGVNEYIDYTEIIYSGKGTPINGQKINYKVKTVDLTAHLSVFSNRVWFWIEGSIPDNMSNGITANAPEEYFITNYPNPFNPVTTIYYNIPKPSSVNITVYNSLGQVVKVLVNEFHSQAANYEVKFDGSNISSGVYFYKIEAGSFSDIKRMLLIK